MFHGCPPCRFIPSRPIDSRKPIDTSATTPSQEPYRSAEAVRRVLPELRKLNRYERRAAGGVTEQFSICG
jgi:hypothetical protein